MAKTIKELNEALDKYINEQEMNEISDELKDRALDKRRMQMDLAKTRADLAAQKYKTMNLAVQRSRRGQKEPTEEITPEIIEEPIKQAVEEPVQNNAENDKLKEILALGFTDVTGPRQKQAGTIMLQGELTGRGYRLEVSKNVPYRAISLNNFGVGTDGLYRTGGIVAEGSLLDCLDAVYDNAKKHLIRMKKIEA